MHATAKDDAERSRIHARLYAPPAAAQPRRASAPAPASGEGMSRRQAEALMAQLNADDVPAGAGRSR